MKIEDRIEEYVKIVHGLEDEAGGFEVANPIAAQLAGNEPDKPGDLPLLDEAYDYLGLLIEHAYFQEWAIAYRLQSGEVTDREEKIRLSDRRLQLAAYLRREFPENRDLAVAGMTTD